MKGRFIQLLRESLSGLRDLFFTRTCAVCGCALDSDEVSRRDPHAMHGGSSVMPGWPIGSAMTTPEMPGNANVTPGGTSSVMPGWPIGSAMTTPVMPGSTGHFGSTGHPLCERCLADIPLTYFWNYSENAAMERLFGCRTQNAAALFFYRHGSPYCEIVRQFKYGRRESLGLWASRLLGDYLAGRDAAPGSSFGDAASGEGIGGVASGDSSGDVTSGGTSFGLYGDVQAVVPVPLHWFKRWRRGFNQAEIIARGVAERLGTRTAVRHNTPCAENSDPVGTAFTTDTQRLPVVPHLLRRVKYTSTQTRRSASSRQKNVSGAFAVNHRELECLKAAGITHILLVDDVLTTGATLSECVRLLQDHFTVSVATLGFVE